MPTNTTTITTLEAALLRIEELTSQLENTRLPLGWIAMPKKPTKRMIEYARWDYENSHGDTCEATDSEVIDVYQKFISGILTQPTTE